jgi:hypothetical protein
MVQPGVLEELNISFVSEFFASELHFGLWNATRMIHIEAYHSNIPEMYIKILHVETMCGSLIWKIDVEIIWRLNLKPLLEATTDLWGSFSKLCALSSKVKR